MGRFLPHTAISLCVFVLLSVPGLSDEPLPADRPSLYFPSAAEAWAVVEPESVGWNSERLAAALEFAGRRKSSGVVVLHHGRILAERYWKLPVNKPAVARREAAYALSTHGTNADGHIIEDVASVQKSIVSVLVGIAQEKGLLDLDDPISKHLGTGWSQASRQQEAAITIRHAITMSTGLNEQLAFVAPAGTRWKYNTTAYATAHRATAAAAGKELNDLTSDWLTGPIGMRDSKWVERKWARVAGVANNVGFATTARDLARFGLLMQAEGKWNHVVILGDRKYLDQSTRPSQTLNPAYGYLWWLNGQAFALRGVRKLPGPLIPTAPADLFAAFGARGRKCYVSRSLGLVVTRLGDTPNGPQQATFDKEFWRLLSQAAPGRR